MNLLFVVILGGWQFIALLVIVLLVLLLYAILARKTVVTVPSMTLVLEKNQYDHGETVNVSGVVKSDFDTPAEGETVVLKLTDSTNTTVEVGSALTDAEGKYTASFPVPDDVAPGGVTVIAECAALGVAATQTFTLARAAPQKGSGIRRDKDELLSTSTPRLDDGQRSLRFCLYSKPQHKKRVD